MKKIICIFSLATAFFIFSSSSVFATENSVSVDDESLLTTAESGIAPSFPDVTTDYPHYAAIEYFREKGVIIGYPDGTFRPEQEANRAEALKIILLSSNINIEDSAAEDGFFPDVGESDWFFPYVNKAKNLEIVSGYDDGTFKPEQIQNTVETLKIIFLTNGLDFNSVNIDGAIFPDVPEDRWYAVYAAYAKEKNIVEPNNDGTLSGGIGITRGKLVELMYRTDMVLTNNGQPFDISTNWRTVEFPKHGFKTKLPFDWRIVEHSDEIIFWHPDAVFNQSLYEVPYPFSASITFHLDHNEAETTKNEYEKNLDAIYEINFTSYQKNTLNLAQNSALEYNVGNFRDDYYIFYPENKVFHIYTSHGISDLTDHLQAETDKIFDNLEYIAPPSDSGESDQSATYLNTDDFLSNVRSNLLVEGAGQITLNTFSDLVITETDTIGIGTGPVDYMFSEEYDVTLKYERNSDTLLDMHEGNTTAF